jgi:hypothetical protein
MGKSKQVEISQETIEVFSTFVKLKKRLFISAGKKQSLVGMSKHFVLFANISESFPEHLFPDWDGLRGVGIDSGVKFIKALKSLKQPIIDFSETKRAQPSGQLTSKIILLDKKNPNKRVEIQTCNPNYALHTDTRKIKLPTEWDLEINLSWDEIREMSDIGDPLDAIEIVKKEKESPVFRNVNLLADVPDNPVDIMRSTDVVSENVISDYQPKGKSFRFVFTRYVAIKNLPRGDYKISFSEAGMSYWINTTDRRYIFALALNPESWFDKQKTPTQLSQINNKKELKAIKEVSAKEYKNIKEYSNAIQTSWRKSIDAIIETGELLSKSKDKFFKDDVLWQTFLESLPFGERTIERLIYISKNKSLLLDNKIYKNLPPSWGTLYEICTIGNDKPLTIYESQSGETSKVKKKGFTEIKLEKRDFVLKALEERVVKDGKKVPLLRSDCSKKEIEEFKRRIQSEFFESPTTQSKSPKNKTPSNRTTQPKEVLVQFKHNTPDEEVDKFISKLEQVLKNNQWVIDQDN